MKGSDHQNTTDILLQIIKAEDNKTNYLKYECGERSTQTKPAKRPLKITEEIKVFSK